MTDETTTLRERLQSIEGAADAATDTAPRRRGRPRGSRNRRSMAATPRRTTHRSATTRRTHESVPGSLSANLRDKLAAEVQPCPTCGNPAGNKSQIARDLGLSTMSLNKFLKGGRVNSDTMDSIDGYLRRRSQ